MAAKGKGRTEGPLPALPASAGELADGGKPDAEVAAWLLAMTKLASEGDARAARALLDACLTVPSLWEFLAVLPAHAERAWAELLAGSGADAEFARRVVGQDIARKRKEVAGEHPSPLESLLAERVALCWAAAQHADAQYARKLAGGMTFKEGEYQARRCEQATRQLLNAA